MSSQPCFCGDKVCIEWGCKVVRGKFNEVGQIKPFPEDSATTERRLYVLERHLAQLIEIVKIMADNSKVDGENLKALADIVESQSKYRN